MPKTAVTRITHSCHLIETGGRTFLTDPWPGRRPRSAAARSQRPRPSTVSTRSPSSCAPAPTRCTSPETPCSSPNWPRSPSGWGTSKGFLGDRLITHSDKNPLRYQDAARDLAPETSVRIVEPGIRIEL